MEIKVNFLDKLRLEAKFDDFTVVADQPLTPAAYRERVASIPTLAHVSVEVNRCPNGDCP